MIDRNRRTATWPPLRGWCALKAYQQKRNRTKARKTTEQLTKKKKKSKDAIQLRT
jgi:hypothetical protein